MTSDHQIESYYRKHAAVYDSTRWAFLFGRSAFLRQLPFFSRPPTVLDIGCGTGNVTFKLAAQYPGSTITGIDVSDHMLKKARRKSQAAGSVRFLHSSLDTFLNDRGMDFDLIVCSYSLTMMDNPENRLNQILEYASGGCYIAIVDFHDTRSHLFKTWMKQNHMTFTPSIFEDRKPGYSTIHHANHMAYAGLWTYGVLLLQKH